MIWTGCQCWWWSWQMMVLICIYFHKKHTERWATRDLTETSIAILEPLCWEKGLVRWKGFQSVPFMNQYFTQNTSCWTCLTSKWPSERSKYLLSRHENRSSAFLFIDKTSEVKGYTSLLCLSLCSSVSFDLLGPVKKHSNRNKWMNYWYYCTYVIRISVP